MSNTINESPWDCRGLVEKQESPGDGGVRWSPPSTIVEAARILGFSESYLRSGFAIERSQVW